MGHINGEKIFKEFLLQQCLNGTSSFIPIFFSATLHSGHDNPLLLEHY